MAADAPPPRIQARGHVALTLVSSRPEGKARTRWNDKKAAIQAAVDVAERERDRLVGGWKSEGAAVPCEPDEHQDTPVRFSGRLTRASSPLPTKANPITAASLMLAPEKSRLIARQDQRYPAAGGEEGETRDWRGPRGYSQLGSALIVPPAGGHSRDYRRAVPPPPLDSGPLEPGTMLMLTSRPGRPGCPGGARPVPLYPAPPSSAVEAHGSAARHGSTRAPEPWRPTSGERPIAHRHRIAARRRRTIPPRRLVLRR